MRKSDEPEESLPGMSKDESDKSLPATSKDESDKSLPATSKDEPEESLPGTSKDESDKSLPGMSKDESNKLLPGTSKDISEESLPGTSTDESEESLPWLSKDESEVSLLGVTKDESEESLLGASNTEVEVEDTDFIAYLRIVQEVNANIDTVPLVKVVIGNVTCDMDSAACTLAYAYLLHKEASKSVLLRDKPMLPVFNINAADMRLKTEVCYIFRKLHIPRNLILTRDRINLHKLAAEHRLELVLVDHHTLEPQDEIFERCVVQVIDHRPASRHWPIGRAMCTIEQVGSCASLVANKIMHRMADILSGNTQVPELIYAAILLDTMNFSQISKRFTDLDLQIVTYLEDHHLREGETRLMRYRELLAARTNVTNLTAYEILMKDAKIGGGNPVCTLPMLVQEFCVRPDAECALHELMANGDYELIILIGVAVQGEILHRDVGFFTINFERLCAEVEMALAKACFLDLTLAKVTYAPIPNLRLYNQHNLEQTRKHMLPLIEQTVRSFREDTENNDDSN